MQTVRTNLLQGTRLDKEVELNSGNDKKILPFLLNLFKELYPSSAPLKEAKCRAQVYPSPEVIAKSPDSKHKKLRETGTNGLFEGEKNPISTATAEKEREDVTHFHKLQRHESHVRGKDDSNNQKI